MHVDGEQRRATPGRSTRFRAPPRGGVGLDNPRPLVTYHERALGDSTASWGKTSWMIGLAAGGGQYLTCRCRASGVEAQNRLDSGKEIP